MAGQEGRPSSLTNIMCFTKRDVNNIKFFLSHPHQKDASAEPVSCCSAVSIYLLLKTKREERLLEKNPLFLSHVCLQDRGETSLALREPIQSVCSSLCCVITAGIPSHQPGNTEVCVKHRESGSTCAAMEAQKHGQIRATRHENQPS